MKNISKKIIIAIDGYSSCGKSTIAKEIATKLNFTYIDSGAMYRTVTLQALRNNNIIDGVSVDEKKLKELLDTMEIKFIFNNKTQLQETFLNKENVEDEIRDIEVSDHVSIISKVKIVRTKMVDIQRELGKDKGIVMDGRDIGTVVFPDAELKIFMTASEKVRAKRRYDELSVKHLEVNLEEIVKNIHKRDFLDKNREESPLRKADDAIELNNSEMTKVEQLQWIMDIISDRFKLK